MKNVLRKLVLVSLHLCVAMTVLSAYIRLADSSIGCDPWPGCFQASIEINTSPGIEISDDEANAGLRVLHRIIASIFGLLAVLIAVIVWWYRRQLQVSPVTPSVILLMTVLLAWVGMRTPDLTHPLIATTNLSGGMLLAALLYHFLPDLTDGKRGVVLTLGSPDRMMMAGGVVTVFLCIVSGAWVSANFAAGGCDVLSGCAMPGDLGAAFDLTRELTVHRGQLVVGEGSGAIMIAHQTLAGLVALVVIGLGVRALVRRQLFALIYLIVLVWLVLSGLAATLHLAVAALHNLFSLMLLLMLVHQYEYDGGAPA